MKQQHQEVPIEDLKVNPEFEKFFENQEEDKQLETNIGIQGILMYIIVDQCFTIIDGYRRYRAALVNGIKKVMVLVVDEEATLELRINLNIQRAKTANDLVKELLFKISTITKKQGRKKDGVKLTYLDQINDAFGKSWKDESTANKAVHVLENDFGNYQLTKQIISGNTSVEAAYQYVTKTKLIDEEKKFSINHRVERGESSPEDANRVVNELIRMETETKGTFIIPKKCQSLNIDCTEIGEYSQYHKKVDLIFTSVYYWVQKFYQIGEKPQPGNEETKQEYCENIAIMVLSWLATLKDSASVMINVGEVYKNGIAQRIPDLLIEAIEKVTRLVFYERLVWSKDNCRSGGNTENIRPRNSVEYILWFVVDPKKVKYKKLTYKAEGAKPQIMRGFGHEDANGKKTKNVIKATSGYSSIWNHIKEQEIREIITTSVGTNHKIFDVVKSTHPSVMSALLPVCPILMTTEEGELVFDPFSGTNSVGHISQLLNRRTLTTELSSLYFKDGCDNLQNGVEGFNADALKRINEIAFGQDETDLNTAA